MTVRGVNTSARNSTSVMTVGGVKAHKHKHKQKHRHKHTATSTSASVMTVRGVKATRDMHLMHGHALEQEVEMCINIFD